jgi:glycosyltransferase involved in cell wall biosynthesis
MNNVSISYVIPTLNSSLTLDMTLCSLQSQKDLDVNIIVVDSGSTDETLAICKRWNVKTLYIEPGNMYRAINAGLRACDTEWLGYINSDDWLYPDSLTRMIAHGESHQADVVYGNCDYTDECGRFSYSFGAVQPDRLLSLFRMKRFGFAQQSTIFRRKVYEKLGGFDECYHLSADLDFYIRGFQENYRFSHLPNPSVACFRIHKNQLSNQRASNLQKESDEIYSKLGTPKIIDWFTFIEWRLNNSTHYLLRLLRQSMLSGKVRITKSMNAYSNI